MDKTLRPIGMLMPIEGKGNKIILDLGREQLAAKMAIKDGIWFSRDDKVQVRNGVSLTKNGKKVFSGCLGDVINSDLREKNDRGDETATKLGTTENAERLAVYIQAFTGD